MKVTFARIWRNVSIMKIVIGACEPRLFYSTAANETILVTYVTFVKKINIA